jgi:ubiquinone/menaquinone biosynthesis C-methylase UbiE
MTLNKKFYSEFTPFYDKMVSYENRKENERSFWLDLFKKYNISKVHDCACGTGHHVILFNELGISCSGSDLSEEMIEKAKENCVRRNINSNIFQADFRNIGNFLHEPLDLLVNLGNSLAYLNNIDDIIKYFKGCYSRLTSEGIMAIETRNFDYLLNIKPRFIPISLKDQYGFIYVIDYFEEKIEFNILYFNLENKDFKTFKTVYFPLLYEKLISLIDESGFVVKEEYAGYKYGKFNVKTSPRMILILKKST